MKKIGYLLIFLFQTVSFAQDDLTVFGAIEKALKNNYQVKLINHNYEVSKLNNSWGQAGLIPTFSLNLGNTTLLQDNTNNPATFFPGVLFNDNFQASLNMSWTVFSGFGVQINKQRLEQIQNQTKGNAIVVIENTIYETIMAYYAVVVQKRKLEITQDLLSYSKEKLVYHQLKNEVGVNTSFDLLEFENQVLADSTNYLLQNLATKNAELNLNLILAVSEEQRFNFTDSLGFDAQISTYDELKQQMLANNSNLKNQYINYELQELNVRTRKSAYYPVVTLNLTTTPAIGYFRVLGDDGFAAATNSWTHTGVVNVRYDIFQGWNRKRNVQIAEIQRDIATLEIEQIKGSLGSQLNGLFGLYQTRVKVEDMSLSRLNNANKIWQLGREKYDLGLINVFNLNDIKLGYEQAVLSYYDRLFELLQSHYDLMRITGGISQQFKISENFDKNR